MLKIAFRVSTLKKFGNGHINRCLSIRSYIDGEVSWFIDNSNLDIRSIFPPLDKVFIEENENSCFNLIDQAKNNNIKTILVDSYNINNDIKNQLSKTFSVILLEDEDRLLKADMIVCPQPIKNFNNNNIKYYGPIYAPISSQFKRKPKENIKSLNINNILISMGYIDTKGVTLGIINSIINKFDSSLKVTIVLGKYAPHIKDIKEKIKPYSNFKLIIEPNNMNAIYHNNNIALGAPGLSHLERLFVGLPTILIPQNKSHSILIKQWEDLECCIQAKNTIFSIQRAIKKLISSNDLRHNIISKGQNLVDGLGTKRIAKEIMKLLKKND
jgi:spore coat polysaccharide biosynthesis predicted glycosyltransferase SpsG